MFKRGESRCLQLRGRSWVRMSVRAHSSASKLPPIGLLLACLWFVYSLHIAYTSPNQLIDVIILWMTRVRWHQKHLVNPHVCPNVRKRHYFCAGKMKLNTSARPLHWGLLLLYIAGFCSQQVSTGNQSSRGQTGGCQTQTRPVRFPEGLIRVPGHHPGRLVEFS